MGSYVLQHLDRGEPALHSAAASPGGLGSPRRPVQHNPGSRGGRCPCLPGDNPPPTGQERKSPPLFHRKLLAAWRAPQEADSEKMAAASAEAGERGDSSNPRKAPDPRQRRQYCPLLICKNPLFLRGPSGADEVPFQSRWRRMNTESGLRSRRLHL